MTTPDDDPPVDDSSVDDSDPASRVDDTQPGDTNAEPNSPTSSSDEQSTPTVASNSTREKLRTVGIAAGLGFGAIVIGLAILLPLFLIAVQLDIAFLDSRLAQFVVQLFAAQIIGMGGLSAYYLWKTGRGIQYVNIRRPTLVESLVILVGPFMIIMLNALIVQLFLAIGIEPSGHGLAQLDDVDPTFYLYLIPLMILIVGPFEELLYRGVVQTRLRESLGPAASISLASLIFVVIHIPVYGLGVADPISVIASIVALFALSIVYGTIYEWTENLTVVALIHGFYNSILLVMLYVFTVYAPEIAEAAEQANQAIVIIGL